MNKRIRSGLLAFLTVTLMAATQAEELRLTVDMENSLLAAGAKQVTYIKVGLEGFEWKNDAARPPLNMALVLDRSGSMDGPKLERAKDAAKMAVGFLNHRDILSIVTYDSGVDVILPSTRVTDKASILRRIDRIESGGNTALFAGVSKGAAELRKFLERDRVNRVILLSDGLANVGPDSTGALVDLGSSLRREGISVTTIGLGSGYNEDLMAGLAQSSDGNHAFVQEPGDLARIFNLEFKDAFEVVAQDVELIISCAPGVKPLRLLNREGEIRNREIRINLNNVYSKQDRYILIEVELPALALGDKLQVAQVEAKYLNMLSAKRASVQGQATASVSSDKVAIAASRNREVVEKVAVQKSVLANEAAVELKDKGEAAQAQSLLSQTASELEALAKEIGSALLDDYSEQNKADAEEIMDEANWGTKRKSMRSEQYGSKNQQRY